MDFEVRNERDASVWLRNDSTGTDLGEVQQGATEWFQAAEGEDVAARDASGNIVHVYSVTPRVPLWTVGPALGGLPVPLRTYDGGPFSESLQSTGFLNGAKALKAAMLFVDFDDVPASSTPSANEQAILQRIVGNGPQWLRDESFGAADLAVTPFPGWRRMPKKAAEYADAHCACLSGQTHGYLEDALRLYGRNVDFSAYDLIFVVPTETPLLAYSPAFVALPSEPPVDAGNGEVRFAVTFGKDSYHSDEFLMLHETCHLFGLPDLYDGGAVAGSGYSAAHVNPWDLMADQAVGRHLLGWHRAKLGWLHDSQLVCHYGGGELTLELADWSTPNGVKAVMVPVRPSGDIQRSSLAYVFEVANPPDAHSPDGVLVYSVNAAVPTWERPLHIRGGADGVTPLPIPVSGTYEHRSAGIALTVVSRTGSGFQVRITAS